MHRNKTGRKDKTEPHKTAKGSGPKWNYLPQTIHPCARIHVWEFEMGHQNDIILIPNTLQKLNEMLQELNDASAAVSLEMNHNRTEIMNQNWTNIKTEPQDGKYRTLYYYFKPWSGQQANTFSLVVQYVISYIPQ